MIFLNNMLLFFFCLCFSVGMDCKTCYMYKFGFRDPTCIPQEFMCDGHKDCFLGLDEKGCGK